MSDLTDEERALTVRLKAIYDAVDSALQLAAPDEALKALAMVVAQRCLAYQNPDRVFLETLDGALAVFRDLTNSKYRNEDPKVS